jgi:hypothetical protein
MNKTNDSRRKKAKDLVASIIENDNMIDIHRFVDKKIWKDLGNSSLSECLDENLDLPCDSKMQRIFKVVEFQLAYLPEIEIGEIKEYSLRPICRGKHSNHIKRSVAHKILNSGKSPNELKNRDISGFITSSLLNKREKEKAAEFAQGLVTDNLLDEISDYVDTAGMNDQHCEAFLRRIGLKVRIILMGSLGF